jgi:uncharacterized membrane protein YoaK (UPF0700 family)
VPLPSGENPFYASAMLPAIALACAGGYADAGSYLLAKSFTGHATGNTILAAVSLAQGDLPTFMRCFSGVVLFISATAVGLQLSQVVARGRRALLLSLALEMMLVAASPIAMLEHRAHADLLLVSTLCIALGLQNGVFDKSNGVSVHTTYVTGGMTQMVRALVHLRREPNPARTLTDKTTARTLVIVCISFAVGAVLAGVAVRHFYAAALWLLELPLVLAVAASWSAAANPEGFEQTALQR